MLNVRLCYLKFKSGITLQDIDVLPVAGDAVRYVRGVVGRQCRPA